MGYLVKLICRPYFSKNYAKLYFDWTDFSSLRMEQHQFRTIHKSYFHENLLVTLTADLLKNLHIVGFEWNCCDRALDERLHITVILTTNCWEIGNFKFTIKTYLFNQIDLLTPPGEWHTFITCPIFMLHDLVTYSA